MNINNGLPFFLITLLTSCSLVDGKYDTDRLIIATNKEIVQSYIEKHRNNLRVSEKPINEDYVKDDLKIITDLVNKIPELPPDYNEFARLLPGFQGQEYHLPEQSGGVDVGFGLTVSNDIYYGGYGNFKISILHHKRDVLLVNIDIYFTSQGHEFIKDRIVEHLKIPIRCSQYGVHYQRNFEVNLTNYLAQNIFPIQLTPTSENYNEQELEYFEIMSNPTNFLEWGRRCGESGEPTIGKITIDSLTKANKYQLVEDILYTPSVVGRIYAMQALERWEWKKEYSLSEKARKAIMAIKGLDISFNVCDGGCMVESMTYRQLADSKPWINPENWTRKK